MTHSLFFASLAIMVPFLWLAVVATIALAIFIVANGILKKTGRYGKAMSWPYAFFHGFCLCVSPFLYRIRKVNTKNIPEEGGALLFANHTAYADVIILGLIAKRPIRFLSWSGFEDGILSKIFMRLMRTIPIAPENAREGLRKAQEALARGELVCIFPEGSLTRNGSIQPFLRGFQVLANRTKVPLIPVYLDGLWDSIFSYKHQRFIWKLPRLSRLSVTAVVGNPFYMGKDAEIKNIFQARQILLELGEKAFSMRERLQKHLAEMLIESAAKHPFRIGVIDHSRERRIFKRGMLIAVAYCLSKNIKRSIKEKRVGIVLPAGTAGMLANYAVSFAGKIPVNLNFTLGRAQAEHCIQQAEIQTTLSVGPVKKQIQDKVPEFPWIGKQIDLLDELKKLKKIEILFAFAQIVLLPSALTKLLWKIPREGGEKEAALLFTSGSSGMPKAAVLSHKNIIANVIQVEDYDILPPKTRLLCNLPIFHCFGFMTLLWFAPTQDIVAISTPSPLDFERNVKAIEEDKVTVMLSTPTFLRTYLKKATPAQLDSVYFVIAGAEKSPDGFAESWEKKFPKSHYLDGYGMTEASPVVSVNKLDVIIDLQKGEIHPGKKAGSVGVLFPGMCAKVVDLDTHELCDFGKNGMLYLKGANIFSGYLNEHGVPVPALDEDAWYKTGDIVTMDEYGFITIKGRLSRFSKIGGEMVPHGTIEEAIISVLNLDSEQVQIVISARPDPAKGEQIVLLTSLQDISLQDLNKKLSNAGLANLWLPKSIKFLEKIPLLGTGKVDLKRCSELAAEN